MSVWLTIPLGIGLIAFIVTVLKRRASNVTALNIDR
jgi:hypothetical protein